MRLLIDKNKAIQILKDRIADIDKFNFNPESWKERTVLDLKEIFPVGSTQYIKIEFLSFDTYVVSEKAKVLSEAKKTAKELLTSYIEFIDEYSKVAQEKKVIKEKDFEAKYYEILKERNELVKDWNNLIKNHEEQIETNSEIQKQLENKGQQLKKIKDETIQIRNVSFSKLMKAFFSLPVWQIISTISIIIAIVVGSFTLGKTYQENASNTQMFELKNENRNLKDKEKSNAKIIIDQDKKINKLSNEIKEQSHIENQEK